MNMRTTTIAYAVLFCIAMAVSYLTWTKGPVEAADEGGIVLIDAKPKEVASIFYKKKDLEVDLEVKEDEIGQYLWVSTSRTTTKKAPEVSPGVTDPTKKDVTQTKLTSFKAGKAGDQLLEDLAPFRVSRELDVAEDKYADFGLDEPAGELKVVTKAGVERKFEVGATAYGHKNIYLRDAESGKVFVIKRSIVSPLDRADTRLPEKELFAGPVTEITRVEIATGESRLVLVQRNRDDAAKASWTLPDSDTPDPSADSWLDKVFRFRASGYVGADEKPETESVFAVKLTFADAPAIKLEVLRGSDDKGEDVWYARSDFTRSLVLLNGAIASDAAADLATLFAGE